MKKYKVQFHIIGPRERYLRYLAHVEGTNQVDAAEKALIEARKLYPNAMNMVDVFTEEDQVEGKF